MAAPPASPSFVERQLPQGGEIFLDHVAHFVPGEAAAADAMRRAGFAPTPASVQSNPGPNGTTILTGTSNITAMMTRGYIEILFKSSNSPLTREFDDGLTRYPGLHLMAFSVADATAASLRLNGEGFRTAPIVALRRPVGTESGETEAAFTVARVLPGEMREGRIQYLTHHTEDAVWQKRWLTHPNGANALVDVVAVVDDVDEAAARYVRFLGREAVTTNMGRGIFLDRGGVQLVNRASFGGLMANLPAPALPFIGLCAVRVTSLDVAERSLRSHSVAYEKRGKLLAVPMPQGLGTGAWFFVERAGDLPWRAQS